MSYKWPHREADYVETFKENAKCEQAVFGGPNMVDFNMVVFHRIPKFKIDYTWTIKYRPYVDHRLGGARAGPDSAQGHARLGLACARPLGWAWAGAALPSRGSTCV